MGRLTRASQTRTKPELTFRGLRTALDLVFWTLRGDEYFDYAPAPVPPQGRWRLYGLGLPDSILKKVYYENASRLLGLKES